VIGSAAMNAFAVGDLRRGRQLAHEAMQGVRRSPYPHTGFNVDFMFSDSTTLAERLSAALQLLDEVGAGLYEYAQVHATVAALAAIFGNLDLARREAEVALDISRRIGNTPTRAVGLYAFGLAFWQSDPAGAKAAHEEYLQIVHAAGYYDFALARVLALQAQLLAHEGNLPAAVKALREGLESAHINGDRAAMAVCVARGAVVMAADAEPETAAVRGGRDRRSPRRSRRHTPARARGLQPVHYDYPIAARRRLLQRCDSARRGDGLRADHNVRAGGCGTPIPS
jgi:tetratricopeptide (TPR) repeat protein